MVIHKACEITNIERVTGGKQFPHTLEMWVTFRVNNIKIETFLSNEEIISEEEEQNMIGRSYNIQLVMSAYALEMVNVKKLLFRQIGTFPKDPIYIVVAPIKSIIKDNHKIIVDVGFDLEIDISGKLHEQTRKQLKVGDWVFIRGKMFSKIVQ